MLDLLSRSRAKAEQGDGVGIKTVVIQEAGLDGFSIHRLLIAEGIESQVVDAASIAVDRRHRRAKTDAIDGETLLRTLMAWARGERRVCSMVRAPSPEEEDRRRLTRERGRLLKERIQHTNRVTLRGRPENDMRRRHGHQNLCGERCCRSRRARSRRRIVLRIAGERNLRRSDLHSRPAEHRRQCQRLLPDVSRR